MSKPLRPTGYPTWCATGATNVVEPDSTHQNLGWGINEAPPSSFLNFEQQRYDRWIRYLDTVGNDYGNGSDGSANLDGSVSGLAWISGPTGSAYSLFRNVYGIRIGVGSGITYQTNGFLTYCTDTFIATGSAIVAANGPNGVRNGTPGGTGISNTVGGGGAGGNAGGTIVINGTGGSTAINSFGGAGGAGGRGTSQIGASGGGVVMPSIKLGLPNVYDAVSFGHLIGGGNLALINGGGGGGSAGNCDNSAGGGGGAGGGVLAIAARNISAQSTQNFQALGGNGSTGQSGNGGGGGGGGGFIMLAYQNLFVATGPSFAAAISCAGGLGGISVGGGTAGSTGMPGTIQLIPAS